MLVARGRIRSAAGLRTISWGYNQRGVVATVATDAPNDTAWQRFLPTGPLALLPVRGGYSNIVWSTTPEQVLSGLGFLLFKAYDSLLGRVKLGRCLIRKAIHSSELWPCVTFRKRVPRQAPESPSCSWCPLGRQRSWRAARRWSLRRRQIGCPLLLCDLARRHSYSC